MKHPTRDASDDPTTQPKLEVQYSTKYSEPDLESVPWFATSEYDLQDLLHELDEYLVNGLHWAGLPVRADEGVFVADDYWDVDESERDLRVVEDPTEKIQVIEGDLATHHLLRSDLTRAERLAFRTLADGGPIHYLEAADQSETSKSTVYRMASKLSDIVRKSHGELRLEDDIVAEKVSNLFATIDDVVDWVEDGIDQLVNDMDGILASDSPLARWARVYGAQISDERGRMEVELRAGSYNEYEIRRILRNGFDASRAVGANAAERFTDAVFVWRDQAGNRITSESAIAVQRDATVRFLGAPMRTLR